MLCTFLNDSILVGPKEAEFDAIIQEMKNTKLNVMVEGEIADFLAVRIKRLSDGTIKMTQPHLIDSILKDLRLDGTNVKDKDTPAPAHDPIDSILQDLRLDGTNVKDKDTPAPAYQPCNSSMCSLQCRSIYASYLIG